MNHKLCNAIFYLLVGYNPTIFYPVLEQDMYYKQETILDTENDPLLNPKTLKYLKTSSKFQICGSNRLLGLHPPMEHSGTPGSRGSMGSSGLKGSSLVAR